MAKPTILETLRHRPLLCDGGMGTQLIARGLPVGACCETWNLAHPDLVADVHQAYRNAGCDLLTTNTFGGTRSMLERHDVKNQVAALNQAGVQAAQKAAGDQAWVLGDVGPFGDFLEPMGDTTPQQLTEIFSEQIHALKSAGADGVIIETMADPNEIAVAIRAARSLGDWAVIATYAFQKDPDGVYRTMMGVTAADAMHAAIDAGASIVGSNCGTALALPDYLRLAEQLVAAAGSTPVILQPNAGAPQTDASGKTVYLATPQDMAALVQPLLNIGVRVIGGCCGTTPAHLAAMAKTLKQ